MSAQITPVVFSHSNPASVWQHQRNITDEQIKACAAKGGVIGLNGLAIFVGDNDTSSEAMLRHLFRLIDLAGPAHVGLGFDYTPDVTVDLSCYTSRTARLLARQASNMTRPTLVILVRQRFPTS